VPHLAAIQKKYGDKVTVVAISDEELATVEAFMKKSSIVEGKNWSQAMSYIVATDPDKSVKNEVFKAAGRRGIPASFVIGKDGKIDWIGHPMRIDEPLAAIIDGSWDRDAARKKYDNDQAVQKEMNKIRSALSVAVRDGNQAAAMRILDEALLRFPENSSMRMQKYNLLLTRFHQYEAAYRIGHQLVENSFVDDSSALNSIAWTIADTEGLKVRDLDLALRAAERANELEKSENAAILDTLARVHYEKGDIDAALKWQKKAVACSDDGPTGASIREVLDKYKKEKSQQ